MNLLVFNLNITKSKNRANVGLKVNQKYYSQEKQWNHSSSLVFPPKQNQLICMFCPIYYFFSLSISSTLTRICQCLLVTGYDNFSESRDLGSNCVKMENNEIIKYTSKRWSQQTLTKLKKMLYSISVIWQAEKKIWERFESALLRMTDMFVRD